jgi:hypothetical protein
MEEITRGWVTYYLRPGLVPLEIFYLLVNELKYLSDLLVEHGRELFSSGPLVIVRSTEMPKKRALYRESSTLSSESTGRPGTWILEMGMVAGVPKDVFISWNLFLVIWCAMCSDNWGCRSLRSLRYSAISLSNASSISREPTPRTR